MDKELTQEQIYELYIRYLDLINLEIKEFGVKPTEVRHLIGRLGEFFCALSVNGKLSSTVNQHGFDVQTSDRKISVKTTAQVNGFVTISGKTLDKVDDLMVIQYSNRNLSILYYGEIRSVLINKARFYKEKNKYELDLSKIKKLTINKSKYFIKDICI